MPVGSVPESSDHVYGPVPPWTNSPAVTTDPTVKSENDDVVMLRADSGELLMRSANTLSTVPFVPVARRVIDPLNVDVGVPEKVPVELMVIPDTLPEETDHVQATQPGADSNWL